MYQFIPGLALNRNFYHDIILRLLKQEYPELPYAAALIGYGSDVLGFDTPTSMDHNWGPRMQIFLTESDFPELGHQINEMLRWKLPFSFQGFPTNFTDPRYDHTQTMLPTTAYPIRHLIEVSTVERYIAGRLPLESLSDITLAEWMRFTDQKLLELTQGEVFYDGLHSLTRLRDQLRFYPRDIWLLRLAAQWEAVSQQEAFIGRCRELHDLLNLKLLAGRLIALLMKICFYLERRYIPYSKWFGRGFQQLNCYAGVHQQMLGILLEGDPESVESELANLYEHVVDLNNANFDLPKIENRTRNFFGRPYMVIFAETIVETLCATSKMNRSNRPTSSGMRLISR
ncbi:hypothetical protein U14_05922 [Candidatus Moduliflexus flocculans]|uniref:DUF4037 domain-containing protein n=1 Tax=Candidatus Moduliflexus flocculans TaxID=1499966 RepID=A0A081BTA4_9BACT|nr:hypothetical protein U14_05922 [Candidatus Moduliflexus flocculans]